MWLYAKSPSEDLAPHDINRPGFLAGEAGKREAGCIALALQQDIGILRAGQRQTVLRPGQPDAGIGAFAGAAAILQRVLRQGGIVTRRIVPGVILKEQARQLRFAVDPARAVAAHAGKATHGRRYRCGGMREQARCRCRGSLAEAVRPVRLPHNPSVPARFQRVYLGCLTGVGDTRGVRNPRRDAAGVPVSAAGRGQHLSVRLQLAEQKAVRLQRAVVGILIVNIAVYQHFHGEVIDAVMQKGSHVQLIHPGIAVRRAGRTVQHDPAVYVYAKDMPTGNTELCARRTGSQSQGGMEAVLAHAFAQG